LDFYKNNSSNKVESDNSSYSVYSTYTSNIGYSPNSLKSSNSLNSTCQVNVKNLRQDFHSNTNSSNSNFNSNYQKKKFANGEISIYDSSNNEYYQVDPYSRKDSRDDRSGSDYLNYYSNGNIPNYNQYSGYKNKYNDKFQNYDKDNNKFYSTTNNSNISNYTNINPNSNKYQGKKISNNIVNFNNSGGINFSTESKNNPNNHNSNTTYNPINKINHLNENNSKNNKNYSLQILLTHYEGICNFILFAKSCTPYVFKADTHLIDDIKIFNFFKNFEKISAFGLDINYVYESKLKQLII
jgi:hypothetical protein